MFRQILVLVHREQPNVQPGQARAYHVTRSAASGITAYCILITGKEGTNNNINDNPCN